jgi:hypothetical protein
MRKVHLKTALTRKDEKEIEVRVDFSNSVDDSVTKERPKTGDEARQQSGEYERCCCYHPRPLLCGRKTRSLDPRQIYLYYHCRGHLVSAATIGVRPSAPSFHSLTLLQSGIPRRKVRPAYTISHLATLDLDFPEINEAFTSQPV